MSRAGAPRGLGALARSLPRLRGLLFGPRRARVGARPRWRFRADIRNGGGVRSLADLRGTPLLIRFIGFG